MSSHELLQLKEAIIYHLLFSRWAQLKLGSTADFIVPLSNPKRLRNLPGDH